MCVFEKGDCLFCSVGEDGDGYGIYVFVCDEGGIRYYVVIVVKRCFKVWWNDEWYGVVLGILYDGVDLLGWVDECNVVCREGEGVFCGVILVICSWSLVFYYEW